MNWNPLAAFMSFRPVVKIFIVIAFTAILISFMWMAMKVEMLDDIILKLLE